MSIIQKYFEKSLKDYSGNKAGILIVNDFVLKLKQEIPEHFRDWMDTKLTGGELIVEPIAEVIVEMDQLAYVYTSLIDEKGRCMVTEGSSPDLSDWGLDELAIEEPRLVSQFLALCYEKTLTEACKSSEFLSLPRSEKVVFSVGEHSGWCGENIYVYKGSRHKIDYGNIRLKRLQLENSHGYTNPDTVERKFMDHLENIDIQKCASELIPVFEEFLHWLSKQNTTSLEVIAIGWSSNFEEETALGGYDDTDLYRWSSPFDFSKWFAKKRPNDLDHDDMTGVRYRVSIKIAEIACLASETIIELEVFKNLPKTDNFTMEVQNRTGGFPPLFYPFK
ncbi:MAG: hypothetical protein L3J20_06535 [Flavobacteriaceae bacterium]|nr:hypothetical protein [Flavobacteriaceae bacterium]